MTTKQMDWRDDQKKKEAIETALNARIEAQEELRAKAEVLFYAIQQVANMAQQAMQDFAFAFDCAMQERYSELKDDIARIAAVIEEAERETEEKERENARND